MAIAGFDSKDLRRALGTFVTGVTVVTTIDAAGSPRGFTANSFTSVSLEPPLVLVCIGRTLTSYPVFEIASHFAVNILAEHQQDISNIFASRGRDRFGSTQWHSGQWGAPILDESAAWFECDTHHKILAGDHLILVGWVRSYGHAPVRPLGYCRGAYAAVHTEKQGNTGSTRSTRVGAILEQEGKLILTVDSSTERFGIVSASALGSANEPASLNGRLASLGIDASLDCLFAVFDDEKSDTLHVYYRGTTNSLPQGRCYQSIAIEDMPWDRLESETAHAMLRRYVDERAGSNFSIYAGGRETGSYRKVVAVPPMSVSSRGLGSP